MSNTERNTRQYSRIVSNTYIIYIIFDVVTNTLTATAVDVPRYIERSDRPARDTVNSLGPMATPTVL